MNATRKVKLKDIKLNLTCKLCLGYLVDATTIIECLHSFCKSCIINYLEKSDREEKYCPICDVQLHSTKPLTSIRSDLMLQEIVYKLVPGLFKNEMQRRREFYANNGDAIPTNPLDSGQVFDELYITSDDVMHLSMEYVTDDEKLKETTRRYLKCPAAVSIFVLKKLLQGKYDLDIDTNIDIMFGDRILPDDFLLMDVAYKYSWTKNGNKPLSLRYRIRGHKKPVIKLEKTVNDALSVSEPSKAAISEDSQTTPANKKKVCNENGSNIMPCDEVKATHIKPPKNGLIPREVSIAPTKTPNGKIRGRKRKNLNYPDIIIESKDDIKNLAKRLKLEKSSVKSSVKKTQSDSSFNAQTQVEIVINNNNTNSPNRVGHAKDLNEVQLQISENGVMSARSVSSNGDDKIVYDLSKKPSSATTTSSNTSPITAHDNNLAEKLLLSGNFHSKTGPTGVTEIICDKPDPISSSLKPPTPKPGYVTLNIPTPKIPKTSQNGRFQTSRISNGNAPDKKNKQKSGQNGSPSSTTKTNEKASSNKSKVLEKIRHRIAAKGSDGANGKKLTPDLGKHCSNVGTSMESGNLAERQRTSGMHSLPIVAPLSSPIQQHQRPKIVNGPGKSAIGSFTLPPELNFSPASGMSVSMISCTSTGTQNGNISSTTNSSNISAQITTLTTPPKRTAHQTTVVNGDLKFTTSPKLILPKPSGDHESSPKQKPPKFFKSRQMNSPGTSPSSTLSLNSKSNATTGNHKNDNNNELKRKTPSPMINGNGINGGSEPLQKKTLKERKEHAKESSPPTNPIDFMKLLSSGMLATNVIQSNINTGKQVSNSYSSANDVTNLIHVSRPLTFPSQASDNKYSSQHLTALSNLAAVNSTDVLNSGIGIAAVAAAAAAASNGNNLPVGMVPFVTDSYCSLPFLNQRLPMAQFSYGYNFAAPGYSVLAGSNTNLTTATTTPVNSSKLKSTNSQTSPGSNSRILNGLLSTTASTLNDDNKDSSGSTLDLTVTKSDTTSAPDKVSDSNPLLVSLLNSSNKSPTENKKSEVALGGSPTSPTFNGRVNKSKSKEKSKSPLIRQLLEKNEANGNASAVSSSTQEQHNDMTGNARKESENKIGKSIVNGGKLTSNLKNGTGEKSGKSSPSKSEMSAERKSNKSAEPNLPVPTDSPKMSNDNDSNISSSAKISLVKEKLLSLSAQNNNIQTLSNNHDKSIDSSAANTKTSDISSDCVTKSNGNSDSSVSSGDTKTKLSSCT